jgi:hypothetical protein
VDGPVFVGGTGATGIGGVVQCDELRDASYVIAGMTLVAKFSLSKSSHTLQAVSLESTAPLDKSKSTNNRECFALNELLSQRYGRSRVADSHKMYGRTFSHWRWTSNSSIIELRCDEVGGSRVSYYPLRNPESEKL